MKRIESIQNIKEGNSFFDVAVIGGGATGLGIALDAASRGYSTIWREKNDLAKRTYSRSTKMVHGGGEYLGPGKGRSGFEALRVGGDLRKNDPPLVHGLH